MLIRQFWAIAACLLLFCRASGAGPRVVEVVTHPDGEIQMDIVQPRLVRELVRQALVVATVEEMGLAVRDATLGEFPAEKPPADALRIALVPYTSDQQQIEVRLESADGGSLWEATLRDIVLDRANRQHARQMPHALTPEDLNELIVQMERFSREALPVALAEAGLEKSQAVPAAAAELDQIETLLAEMDMLAQFAALRLAHQQARSDGGSEKALGAIVRAYANLGQLTTFHWSAGYKAYRARSLLYAQRMVQKYPDSDNARLHRAYALALAGLHDLALRQLDALAQRPEPMPTWATVIEPICRYQMRRLIDMATNGSQRQLAALLAFDSIERSTAQAAIMNVAQVSLAAAPNCFRIIDGMCDQSGPGWLNGLTVMGPDRFSTLLGQKLEHQPGLPESIRQLIQQQRRAGGNPRGRMIVVDALRKAALSDDQSPSWAVLADLICQTSFVHVMRRADLVAVRWGQDASGYVASTRHLVEGHPYQPLIELYGLRDTPDSAEAQREQLQKIVFRDLTRSTRALWRHASERGVRLPGNRTIHTTVTVMSDPVAGDLEHALMTHLGPRPLNYQPIVMQRLRAISPHSPLLIAMTVRFDWNNIKDQAEQIERDYGDHPSVAHALGDMYDDAGQWEAAERCYRAYLKAAPDRSGYEMLANLHKRRGDDEKWVETLNEYLNDGEAYGLEKAQVGVVVAQHYMERKEYRKALLYAEMAAETRASWAMVAAARVHTALGNWKEAEAWVREEAEHYGNIQNWFEWCASNGRGDIDAAREAALRHAARLARQRSSSAQIAAAGIYLMVGDLERAQPLLTRAYQAGDEPWAAMMVAIIAHDRGDDAARDAALAAVAQMEIAAKSPYPELAELFRSALASSPHRLDLAKIDQMIERQPPNLQATICYLTARFLEQYGQGHEATRFLLHGAKLQREGTVNSKSAILCRIALRTRGLPEQ